MFKPWYYDIRFWIITFFLIRLIGITNPPIENTHAWRQVTGLMIARNFYETEANILYPRLDNAGNLSGITGTEFPLMNYAIFLVAKIFGWQHWYGRLINLIVSSIGICYFFRLVERFFSYKTAFYASLVLLLSAWFMYSRKTTPDTFSTSLVIMGLWYAFEYFKQGSFKNLIAFFLLALAGILSKIPAGFLLVVLALPVLSYNFLMARKAAIIITGALILLVTGAWYFYWVPYLVEKYGFWHYYMGSGFREGFESLINNLDATLHKFHSAAMNIAGFILFLAGIVVAFYRKNWLILQVLGICFAAFFVFMLKAGWAFHHHGYYILPFVPVMALLAGFALGEIKVKWLQKLVLAIIVIDGIGSQYHDFALPEKNRYLTNLEHIADKFSSKKDLIIITGGDNPAQLYMAHRKGWTVDAQKAQDADYIKELQQKGAAFLFTNKNEVSKKLGYKLIYEDDFYFVYQL